MNCEAISRMRGGLVVSCQAEGRDPFNRPEYVALFAQAAVMGGALGIRTEGIEKLKAIKRVVDVPVIGLLKSAFEDGTVRITGSMAEVESLIEAGADIVAIDGTFRLRDGVPGPEFIRNVKKKFEIPVLADIARESEALECISNGADCVSTTLSGYTPETKSVTGADFDLIRRLSKSSMVPVFAEGKLNTPELAAKAMECGAYAVIAGTAITRPRVVTRWYADAIKEYDKTN